MNDLAPFEPRRVSYPLPLHRPVVTWLLLGLIGLIFVVQTLAGGSTDTETLVRLGAKVTPLIAAGEYWRLLTAMFLHIGPIHLFFNGYALLAIGTELERFFGWQRFLAIYLLSGLWGSLASFAFSPHLSAGASGAIFGLIGGLAAFFALHRQQLGSWGQRRLANIAFLIAINLFLGFTQPGIDNLAHLGGLLSGLALGWALAPRYRLDPLAGELVDGNRLARYWPVLALAIVLLVAGTALATALQQNSVQSYLLRAEAAIEEEDWQAAEGELAAALAQESDTENAILYFYLGLARNHLQKPQLAAEAYERALALEPDDPHSHWNLALTYLELERYAQAQVHFEAYLALEPGGADEVQPYLDELRRLVP